MCQTRLRYNNFMFKNAIALYEPINTYKPLADNIGTVDGPLAYMSYPGLPFLSIPFPTRMTVVNLANGDLWLHSPTAYTPELAGTLSQMGRVCTPCLAQLAPLRAHYRVESALPGCCCMG